jgi:multiple sugar transport system substrate-binding protein
MVNNSLNKLKKSILPANRIEVFLLIAIFIFFVSSVFFSLISRSEIRANQVNLFFSMHSEEKFGKEIIAELLREFNEKNPDITIRLISDAPAALVNPDILIFDDSDFSVFVAANVLAELIPFNSFGIDENNDLDNSLQLAVPLVSFIDLLFYNIDILSAAGFNHPPRTRDEFLAYTRAVSRVNKPGVSGTAMSLNPNDRQALSRDVFSWIWAAGGNLWPERNNPASLMQASLMQASPMLNTRAIIEDFSFFGTLYREGLLAPDVFETTGDQRIEEFAQGRVAMMIASSRVIPYLRERMGEETFGVTTIPHPGTSGRYNIKISSIYAGINSSVLQANDTSSLQAAKSFIEFLTEKSALFCAELNAVPGSIYNLIPDEYIRQDPLYSKIWDIFEISQIIQGFSGNKNAMEYQTVFLEELQIFFDGARTAQQTVAAIQRRWEEVAVDEESE